MQIRIVSLIRSYLDLCQIPLSWYVCHILLALLILRQCLNTHPVSLTLYFSRCVFRVRMSLVCHPHSLSNTRTVCDTSLLFRRLTASVSCKVSCLLCKRHFSASDPFSCIPGNFFGVMRCLALFSCPCTKSVFYFCSCLKSSRLEFRH